MTVSTRHSARKGLLLAFFALYFYRLGVTALEGLFNYPFWQDMGPMMSNADFMQLRSDHIWKVYILLVAPAGVLVLVTAALAAIGTSPVPRWIFVGALVFQLVSVISTVAIQLPIQRQLDTTGFDPIALDKLISSDLVFRKLPSLIEGVFVITALWKVITLATQASLIKRLGSR